jgi:Asp/Glu/hydantoin racemase
MHRAPRIALLHATQIAVEPIQDAFRTRWPEAELVNLLDDGLTIDRARDGDALSDKLMSRFVDFGRYAASIDAQGILVTCSAFGPAIERLQSLLKIPVVKPNEAMFQAALRYGSELGMLATFAPSVSTMEQEFKVYAERFNPNARLTTVLVEGAIDRLRQGDADEHNRLLQEDTPKLRGKDAIMLAHFSTSVAAKAVRERTSIPILTAPHAAVDLMRDCVEGKTACVSS